MYLLDTNVCIDFLLHPTPSLISRFDLNFGQLAVSTITVAELRVGKQTSTDPKSDERRLNEFLAALDVRVFDERAALEYGNVVRSSGIDRKSFDRLIGAHAVAVGLTLVTNNLKHFADVPGLKVENWTV
jgi:tRNA(fMet)-specific endonuclease VapC